MRRGPSACHVEFRPGDAQAARTTRMPRLTASRVVRLLWAAPCSLVGLVLAALVLLAGGRAGRHSGALLVAYRPNDAACGRLARHLRYRAVTLGHVVIGVTRHDLHHSLAHELVHVRQYERWGLAFFLAYPAASLWSWLRGRRPYWDNPFEIEARRLSAGRSMHEDA